MYFTKEDFAEWLGKKSPYEPVGNSHANNCPLKNFICDRIDPTCIAVVGSAARLANESQFVDLPLFCGVFVTKLYELEDSTYPLECFKYSYSFPQFTASEVLRVLAGCWRKDSPMAFIPNSGPCVAVLVPDHFLSDGCGAGLYQGGTLECPLCGEQIHIIPAGQGGTFGECGCRLYTVENLPKGKNLVKITPQEDSSRGEG